MLSLLFTSRLGVPAREAVLPLINDRAMSLVLAADGGHSLDFGVLTRYNCFGTAALWAVLCSVN